MKIKVGLPTDDKLYITGCFAKSKFFRITEIEKWKIVREEYRENTWADEVRKNPDTDMHQQVYELISDCDVFMTDSICPDFKSFLKKYNKEIVLLKEKNMTMAIGDYILEECKKESNTCCCP